MVGRDGAVLSRRATQSVAFMAMSEQRMKQELEQRPGLVAREGCPRSARTCAASVLPLLCLSRAHSHPTSGRSAWSSLPAPLCYGQPGWRVDCLPQLGELHLGRATSTPQLPSSSRLAGILDGFLGRTKL